MLVRDGRRGSYLAGGILQLLLAVLFAFCLLPVTLATLGIDVTSWNDFLLSLGDFPEGVAFYGTNAILLIMFVLNFFALFVHRSASSTFLKLSTLLPIATFAAVGLDVLVILIMGQSLGIATLFFSDIFKYIVLAVAIVSLLFLLLGIIFTFKNRNNPNRATTYQIIKAILWLVFFVFSYVLSYWITVDSTLSILFGYSLMYPAFFAWYFLIAGIWQICSSRKWARPIDPGNNGGYPMPPYGYMPPPFYPTYPPQPAPYYPPQGWQPPQGGGYKQGLAEGETATGFGDTGLEEAVMAIEAEKTAQSQQKKLLKEQKKLEKKAEKEKKKQRVALAVEPTTQQERKVGAEIEPQPTLAPAPDTALKTKQPETKSVAKKTTNKTDAATKSKAKAEKIPPAKSPTEKASKKSVSKATTAKSTDGAKKDAVTEPEAQTNIKIPPFPPAKAPANIMKKKKETKKEG